MPNSRVEMSVAAALAQQNSNQANSNLFIVEDLKYTVKLVNDLLLWDNETRKHFPMHVSDTIYSEEIVDPELPKVIFTKYSDSEVSLCAKSLARINDQSDFNIPSLSCVNEDFNVDEVNDEPCKFVQGFNSDNSITLISENNSKTLYLKDSEVESMELKEKIKTVSEDYLKKKKIQNIHSNEKKKQFKRESKSVKSNLCILNRKCQQKCWYKFSENDRKNIFNEFWQLKKKSSQFEYLIRCVRQEPIKRKRTKDVSRRSMSFKYFLFYMGETKQVCQQFLLSTLDITQRFLMYSILKNRSLTNVSKDEDHEKKTKKTIEYIDENICNDDKLNEIQKPTNTVGQFCQSVCKKNQNKSVMKKQNIDEILVEPNSCSINKMCQQKCWEKFSENKRKIILDEFWQLNKKSRREYLIRNVLQKPIKRKQTKNTSKHSLTFNYYLFYKNESKRVCETFLLTFLDITKQFLMCSISKNHSPINASRDKDHEKITKKTTGHAYRNICNDEKLIEIQQPSNTISQFCQSLCKTNQSENTMKKVNRDVKSVKPNSCIMNKKCQQKCWGKFTENERKSIFDLFWKLKTKSSQREYLMKCVRKEPIKRKRTKVMSRRSSTYKYYLSYGCEVKQVCQQFLLTTLDITQKFLIYSVNSLASNKSSIDADHEKIIQTVELDDANIFNATEFIQKLPAVPSSRASINKRYLPTEFMNNHKLYTFYKEYCEINSYNPVSKCVFKSIFKEKYIGFHVPKKDKCNICSESSSDHFDQQNKHDVKKKHMEDMYDCEAMFSKYQNSSNPNVLCVSFDFQKVLNTPMGDNLNLHFGRKFNVYNFTIYENRTQNSFCYLWGENVGSKSCNEIASCIYNYLIKVDQRKAVTSIALFCDSCPMQNKNITIFLMIVYALKYKLNYVTEIKLSYLLPGHACMPVDTISATVEKFVRKKTIWAPSEWATLIRNARTNPKPLEIVEMNISDFLDWKAFSNTAFSKYLKHVKNRKVIKPNLKSLLFQKKENEVVVKVYDSYKEIQSEKLLTFKKSKKSVKLPKALCTEKMPISMAKFNDLIKLCNDGIIPQK